MSDQIEIGFPSLVEQGNGDIPIVHLKFRCTNCGSRFTDCGIALGTEAVTVNRLQPPDTGVIPSCG